MAARFSDIANTKHNLGSSGINPSAGSSEICVFCHTPHGSDASIQAPLWNRKLSSATYTTYGTDTLDALDASGGAGTDQLPDPAGSSKLCLSCHDGTLAIASGGNILNTPGSGTTTGISNIDPLSTNKNLGADLTNDHPISITFDSELDTRDGEMRSLDGNQSFGTHIGRTDLGNFTLGLEPTGALSEPGQVQCTTCHDPHINGFDDFTQTDTPSTNIIKFLRAGRFQKDFPNTVSSDVEENKDIICLYCHTKGTNDIGYSWKISAHADPTVADEEYKTAAASEREFPEDGTNAIKVWEAACLNCHDTHTASGQRRLLRKNATLNTMIGATDGTNEQQNTCYQCHTTSANSILQVTSDAPDIQSEFAKDFRMPITNENQQTTTSEIHDISDIDFRESAGNLNVRHAECTDCHNPHRVIRNSLFNNQGDSSLRTHETAYDSDGTGPVDDGRDGHLASGVLRGAWGVVPTTAGSVTGAWDPTNANLSYTVKAGDPGTNPSTLESEPYLTREYQLCFKCHSDYAFGALPPSLLPGKKRTDTTISNGMTAYTNVAAEFSMVQATIPATSGTDQGENNGTSIVNHTGLSTAPRWDNAPGEDGPMPENNHRSWHPVMFPTGRGRDERNMGATAALNLKAPWVENIGTQTMQCSDCHGGETSYTPGTGANLSQVQGPHGSDSKFLLKSNASNLWSGNGNLSNGTGLYNAPNNYGFCGNCHQPRSVTDGSGFYGNHLPDGAMGNESCMMCHIAVPHGWKNKAFLANLLCVGPEGGEGAGCTAIGTDYSVGNIPPYYNGTRVRISTWRQSGAWIERSCEDDDNKMQGSCPKSN